MDKVNFNFFYMTSSRTIIFKIFFSCAVSCIFSPFWKFPQYNFSDVYLLIFWLLVQPPLTRFIYFLKILEVLKIFFDLKIFHDQQIISLSGTMLMVWGWYVTKMSCDGETWTQQPFHCGHGMPRHRCTPHLIILLPPPLITSTHPGKPPLNQGRYI